MPRRCCLLVLTVVCLGPAAPHAGAQQAAEAVTPPAAVPAAADQTPLLTTGAQTRRLQRALGVRADGMLGRRSRAALRRWEGREGLLADGLPDPETLGRLGIDLTPAQIARVAPPPAAPAGGVLYAAGPPA